MTARFLTLTIFILLKTCLFGQDSTSNISSIVPEKFIATTSSRINKIEKKLTQKSERILNLMQKEEKRLRDKTYKIDSVSVKAIFNEGKKKYDEFRKRLANVTNAPAQNTLDNYIPYLDTLRNSLKFLRENVSSEFQDKYKNVLNEVDQLKNKFELAGNIRQYLRERRQYLKEQLSKLGLDRDLKKLNKEVYYYSQFIKDYKEILSDPRKIEEKTISLLIKIPAFKRFIQKNSILVSIFPVSADNSAITSLTGLQTRASVQQFVQNTTPISGPNPQQFIQQQLENANNQLNSLKSKVSFVDLSGNAEEMPDFKPNNQKTKPFFKRFVFGANMQIGKINNVLPTTSEFALSLGYKLNDNGVIGIGSSYKLGLGNGLRNIQFTSQGYGIRSFIDWKLKGKIYLSGGYEKNYLPQLQNISILQNPELWQESGLIGISRKFSPNKKRSIYMQALFDFLSYKNVPRSQPLIFRTGWNF